RAPCGRGRGRGRSRQASCSGSVWQPSCTRSSCWCPLPCWQSVPHGIVRRSGARWPLPRPGWRSTCRSRRPTTTAGGGLTPAARDAEASTFWFIGHYLATTGFGNGYPPGWSPPGAAVAAVLIIALAGVATLGLWAPVRPRMAQLAFLAVFAFLITTKVWSPQYSLWLVPLVALARPRWRITLLWQFSAIVVWVGTLPWLLGFNDGS